MNQMTKESVLTDNHVRELAGIDEDVDRYFLDTLTKHDRCDRCLSQAVSQVLVSPDIPLILLCGHHHRASRQVFISKGYAYRVPENEDQIFTIGTPSLNNKARDAGSA